MSRTIWLIAVFVLGLLSSTALSLAERVTSVPAGNIFANQQAQNVCPKVCGGAGGKWDGTGGPIQVAAPNVTAWA